MQTRNVKHCARAISSTQTQMPTSWHCLAHIVSPHRLRSPHQGNNLTSSRSLLTLKGRDNIVPLDHNGSICRQMIRIKPANTRIGFGIGALNVGKEGNGCAPIPQPPIQTTLLRNARAIPHRVLVARVHLHPQRPMSLHQWTIMKLPKSWQHNLPLNCKPILLPHFHWLRHRRLPHQMTLVKVPWALRSGDHVLH